MPIRQPAALLSAALLKVLAFATTAMLIGTAVTVNADTRTADTDVAETDAKHQFSSGPEKVSLIELYTSEGCSSCPPADRWLSEIAKGKALWSKVVPVAFHVSYWDRLGWPDKFAQRRFDTRQRALAARVDSGVYTPGLFRDGAEYRSWRRTPPTAVGRASNQRTGTTNQNSGELQLRDLGANRWELTYTPAANAAARPARAFAAVLGNNLSNPIGRGENAGKLLKHDFVVLQLADTKLRAGDNNMLTAGFTLDPSVTGTPAIAAWVTDATGAPLQAVGGALN